MSRSEIRSGVSPALAAFISGAVSTILTVVATLVTLRSTSSTEALFEVLIWVLYCVAGATALVLLWIIGETLKSKVAELNHIREIDTNVSRYVRVRRRTDQLAVKPSGSLTLRVSYELESAESASIPWFTHPVSSGVASASAASSVTVTSLNIDGVQIDTNGAFRKTALRTLCDRQYDGVIIEEGYIRVPVSLDPTKRRCSFTIVMELGSGAFAKILEEEYYSAIVEHITDEINVELQGVDGLSISFSPLSDYRIKAITGEVLDPIESQLQSPRCHMRDGIHWRSSDAKIGYTYAVHVTGQLAAS